MLTQPFENKIEHLHRRRLGKSVAHAEIQHHLKKQIPAIELEKKLGSRRADAVWEERKIVFELQLSSLTQEQALLRSQDYTHLGYQVVWILHEGVFNGRDVSPSEKFLRAFYPTYFTNGAMIYDQIEVIEGRKRRYRGDPLPIQISSPNTPFLKIPDRSWPLQFAGDLHTWCGVQGAKPLHKIVKLHRLPRGIRWWFHWIGFRILELVSRNPK